MSKNRHKHTKANYHPPKVGGIQKQHREREANKLLEDRKKKRSQEIVDMSKPDWSLK